MKIGFLPLNDVILLRFTGIDKFQFIIRKVQIPYFIKARNTDLNSDFYFFILSKLSQRVVWLIRAIN